MNEDPEKQTIVDFMMYMKKSNKSQDEKLSFWRKYLLEHHADKHAEWYEGNMHDVIVRQVALCDFVKRLKPWFMQ